MAKKRLRHGFTTGSAAAAGSKAGIIYIATRKTLKEIDIPLPQEGRLTIPIECIEEVKDGSRVTVIKDAGDDPDVTNRAKIRSTVYLFPEGKSGSISIEGGEGVGRVTRPGLPIGVGEPAINPVPRQQIRKAVLEGIEETGIAGSVSVTIDVVNGEKIAKKTLNPRLGIIGGISILGTRGTVMPYSNESYRDTITMSMDVAMAEGLKVVALSTGRRSEKLLMEKRPDIPEFAFIQVADFFSFSLNEAAKRGFHDILYACFFAKLIKMAQGHPYTHAKKSRIDFNLLSQWAISIGMNEEKAHRVARANTARETLGIILKDPKGKEILQSVAKRAIESARGFAGRSPNLTYYLFDFDGRLLVKASKEAKQ
jgi:cobalt-precorrin-5B (C1)-methyltransferase